MKLFIVYNQVGKFIRSGGCQNKNFFLQAKESEFVFEGTGNDVTQKIKFDGLDIDGQPVNPRVVDKTPEEIEADNPTPPETPFEKRTAHITNEQWQDVIKRLDNLEKA